MFYSSLFLLHFAFFLRFLLLFVLKLNFLFLGLIPVPYSYYLSSLYPLKIMFLSVNHLIFVFPSYNVFISFYLC